VTAFDPGVPAFFEALERCEQDFQQFSQQVYEAQDL
jgi:hypothetical protein